MDDISVKSIISYVRNLREKVVEAERRLKDMADRGGEVPEILEGLSEVENLRILIDECGVATGQDCGYEKLCALIKGLHEFEKKGRLLVEKVTNERRRENGQCR